MVRDELVDDGLWIRRFTRPMPGAVRLYCFPHAGGSATYFRPLSQLLPDVEVLAVQYPGRQDRRAEPPAGSIAGLADGVLAAMRPHGSPRYALLGHSMGAIVAFEVARRLEKETGPGPVQVFVSGRRAPTVRGETEDVHRRDDAGLTAELRLLGGTGQEFLDDEDLREMILPAVRADYRTIETYEYQAGPPLRAAVTGLVGETDPRAGVDEVTAWRAHTVGEFAICTFPGGHFYLDGAWRDVAHLLSATLLPTGTRVDP